MSTTITTATATVKPSTPATPPLPQLIPSLPDDVALNIIARIPRCHHPTLSLVSKSMKSLISSPLLYSARSLLKSSEHFLYITLRLHTSHFLRFYSLYQNPSNPINPKYSLIPLPLIPSPSLVGSAFAALDHKIYVLGGSIKDIPSSQVWSLDCRTHTWELAPNMHVSREFAAAGVVDDKIFVIGGCVVDNWARSTNWAEAYDAKTGKWNSVPSPIQIRDKWMHASAVIDGKVYAMADRNGVCYEVGSGSWGTVESDLDNGWRGRACVIDGVLFCYDYLGNIRGYDVKEGMWKELKGLKKGLPRFLCGATMANLGGKLMVVWESKNGNGKEMEIRCAEIEVRKDERGELWGNIEWSDVVLLVPREASIMHCLAVAL
ncbi:F-box/kelch-repeat protein SKIP6 [Durio zibethinus]|uniref:F-box/kelch-repeat protein SKIP6 n=1 Tax=Durio zibethinus TaxID=66656 RepID=A0A6P6BCT5_DURZI|nr:F-box/kelch-repeat protein SKIP6 [Durio zibethinus]XP_022774901.1 F-box/kelch-repeat protein SKIP6 [Durio zibethinus]